jgi:hypothetical protein
MNGDHDHARLQQPVDEDPIGALDRYPRDMKLDQLATERRDPGLVVRDEALAQPRAGLVDDAEGVFLARPVNSRNVCHLPSSVGYLDCEAGHEEPLRVLIGWRSRAPRPVGASGASHRREALVSRGPSMRQASKALSRRWSALIR